VDGCETDITTTSNCGGCGITCIVGQICSQNVCTVTPGQVAFKSYGDYTWTAPPGVTSVSVVVIGGGGGGDGNRGLGGGGGALAYGNNISVTPGATYSLHVGRGGDGGWGNHYSSTGGPGNTETDSSYLYGQPGERSWFISPSVLYAEGGSGRKGWGNRADGGGTARSGGGMGGIPTYSTSGTSGGAGGGVYILGGTEGGLGGFAASGGAGGGAGGYTSRGGDAVIGPDSGGAGGSIGDNGDVGNSVYGGRGGNYGGGGSAGPTGTAGSQTSQGAGGPGAGGAIRIVWGYNRYFPSTNAEDQ
jgi:hypothetical protein